jgi:hypothetical protein
MTRSLTLFLLGFLMLGHAVAQVPSVRETRVQVPASPQGPGGWYDQIENLGDSTIVALQAVFTCSETSGPHPIAGGFRFDPLVVYGGRDQPIPPGQSHSFPIQPWAVDCPGGVVAVIFSDGHSEGSPDVVSDIYKERLGVYEALSGIKKLLNTIITSGADPNTIASELMARAHSASQNTGMNDREKFGQMGTFALVATVLKSQQNLHVPSDDTVRRQDGIETVMKAKNISRQQAHAITINNKLDEWNRDLEQYLQPSPSQ